MEVRFYTIFPKGSFAALAKKLGAKYIEGEDLEELKDADIAIFVAPGKWQDIDDSDDQAKTAIKWKKGEGVDVGQLLKSCDNFEDTTKHWYEKKDVEWIIKTLTKINKHLKK